MTLTREHAKQRAAELRAINARLHSGEVPSLDVLRRAWTLAGHGAGLPEVREADLAGQIGGRVNAWAGREKVRLLGFLLQGGQVVGQFLAQPWADESRTAAYARQRGR